MSMIYVQMCSLLCCWENQKKTTYNLTYFVLYRDYLKMFLEIWKNLFENSFGLKVVSLGEQG